MTQPQRVLVIGLDALTPKLTERWAGEGRLPNLRRFMDDGAWGTLNSVPNRNSAAAWSTMTTGLNPGKHGIYWFTEDDPTTYSYRFINASYRRGKTMWRVLSEENRRVIVINVPLTYPAEEVNGMAAAGLDAPGVDATGFTYPPEFRDELIDAAGGEYFIHSGVNLVTDPERRDEGLDRLHRSIDARSKAAAKLMSRHEWDFFMVVFTESDVVQHYFFKQMESPEPSDPEHHRTAIRDVYEHLDRVVGDLLEAVDDDTLVIVVSDHGARRDEGLARSLPNWLEQLGLLAYKGQGGGGPQSIALRAATRAYRVLDKRLSTETKHRLSERFPKLRRGVEVAMSFSSLDWTKTRAYTDGKRPEVWINLKGRQPEGIVEPDDFDAVCDQVIEGLTAPRSKVHGTPVVTKALRREDAYRGPFVDRSPDIVIEWSDEGAERDLVYPDGTEMRVEPDHLGDDPLNEALSGGHSQHGVVGFLGAGAGRGKIEGAEIADIAPTVLFLLDAALPEDVDGRILRQGLDPEVAARKERLGASNDLTSGDAGTGYSEEEEKEIRERLQALGYVE